MKRLADEVILHKSLSKQKFEKVKSDYAALKAEREERNEALRKAIAEGRDTTGIFTLRDALRISYRLLQGGIIVLVALYVFSGFQSIDETERGIRVLTGRIVKDDLRPDLFFKKVEVEAVAVNGRPTPAEVKFLPGQRDLYARTLRFPGPEDAPGE